jgi:hypothetical protein
VESIAIWYSKKQSEKVQPSKESEKAQPSEVELHFNFWKILAEKNFFRGNHFHRFLDIGLKITNPALVGKVYIYYPFKLDKSEITDLGSKFEDVSLLGAVFNENYGIEKTSTSDYLTVTDGEETIFHIYKLGNSCFNVEEFISESEGNNSPGSIIWFDLPICKDIHRLYIRIRIKSDSLSNFSSIEENPATILSEAFEKVEIFDFRANSHRHLPNKIIEKHMSPNDVFSIKRVHFFYICSYKENFILSHEPFSGARKLEKDIWNEYITINQDNKLSFPKDTFVAYHWKTVPKQKESEQGQEYVKDINILMKTSFRHKNWITITGYLIFIVIISVISGIIGNAFYERLPDVNILRPLSGEALTSENSKKAVVEKECN